LAYLALGDIIASYISNDLGGELMQDKGGGYIKDELGGIHDGGVGWNPHGVFCGECGSITCKKCPYKDRKGE
jgi:hypothetical protein